MPRKRVDISSEFPYHVSARCHNREWFDLPMQYVWSVFEDYLFLTKSQFNLRLHNFVLMNNHFHLLVSTPDANISAAMKYFMQLSSRELSRAAGRINQTFGGRHHKTLVGSYHYYMNCYKYVYQNPVRAGICSRPEDYQFSTLNGLLGKSRLTIPVEEDTLLFAPDFNDSTLRWLNQRADPKREADIRLALRRSEFKLRRASRRQKNPLETELL